MTSPCRHPALIRLGISTAHWEIPAFWTIFWKTLLIILEAGPAFDRTGNKFRVSQVNYPTDMFTQEDNIIKSQCYCQDPPPSLVLYMDNQRETCLIANTDLENVLYHTPSLKFWKMGLMAIVPHPGLLGDQMHPRLWDTLVLQQCKLWKNPR